MMFEKVFLLIAIACIFGAAFCFGMIAYLLITEAKYLVALFPVAILLFLLWGVKELISIYKQ